MPTRPRILILANMKKEPVLRAIEEFGPWLRERAEVGAGVRGQGLRRAWRCPR